ncbi:MAG TPA: hypothetical protein VK907_05770 [Phnomibacter sp.]|nr:hypothetical protein [Phnomibacter sp.]
MLKYLRFACLALLMLSTDHLLSQEFSTGKFEFNGITYPAYVKDVNASVDQSLAAVKELFASRGAPSPRVSRGILIYRRVSLPASGNLDLHDIFVKVDRLGKKNDNSSRINLIITRPGAISEEKPAKGVKTPPVGFALAGGGAAVFDALQPGLENQVYLQAVSDHEAALKKAEKKLKDLQDDRSKMEKQLAKLQSDLEKNLKDTQDAIREVEQARGELERQRSAKPGQNF